MEILSFRMSNEFGCQLRVPVFGDRTGGKLPVRLPYIAFDRNGQPKYSAARNHPRVVQEPVATFHWGANSDMQRFLTNSKSYDEVTRLGIDQDDFIKSLNTLGIAGLEQNTGNYIVIDYVTGYQRKGNASTKEWCSMLQDFEDTLHAKDKDPAVDNENGNATMKKLVGKHIHQIANYQDVSKEEASFCLSGGQLRYNSMIVKTCSLNQVEFSNFKSEKEAPDSEVISETSSGGNNSWTYSALRKRYEEYGEKGDGVVPLLNFYTWCARHRTRGSSPIVPDFVGYYKRPNWPLDEEYARTILILYKK
jgi:hypothetical protein